MRVGSCRESDTPRHPLGSILRASTKDFPHYGKTRRLSTNLRKFIRSAKKPLIIPIKTSAERDENVNARKKVVIALIAMACIPCWLYEAKTSEESTATEAKGVMTQSASTKPPLSSATSFRYRK